MTKGGEERGGGFPTGSFIKHIGGGEEVSVDTRPFFRRRRDRPRRSRRFGLAGPPSGPSGSPPSGSARRSGPPAVRVAAAGLTATTGRTAAAAGRLPRPIGPGGGGGRKKLTVLYRDDIIIIVFVNL